jgi:hypothetical protein
VGLLQDLEARFLTPILERIKAALGPFGKLFDLLGKFFRGFRDSFTKGVQLGNDIKTEIFEWRNFREALPVRTGVISLPAAIDKSQELIDQVKAAWSAIVDLAKQIKKQAQGQVESPTEEAEQAVKDIEGSGIKSLLEKFPKLAKGLEKILGVLAIAVGVVESIQSAVDDLTAIVAAARGLREEIETGSTIFLSHKNPRKIVHLDDGTSMKIRIGNLHQ